MKEYPDTAKRLYEIAQKLNMKHTQIAAVTGVTKQAVGKWFAGTSQPSWEALYTWRNTCGVNDEWIMTGKGNMFTQTQGVAEPTTEYHNANIPLDISQSIRGLAENDIQLLRVFLQALTTRKK